MIDKPAEVTRNGIREYITDGSVRGVASTPILSSLGHRWQNILLHRYNETSGGNEIPSNYHRVSVNLANPVYIERVLEGHKERRWSERGCCSVMPVEVPVIRTFKGRADYLAIYIDPHVVEEVAACVLDRDVGSIHLVDVLAVPDPALDRLARLFHAETERPSFGSRLYVDSLTRALGLHLLRRYSTQSPQMLSVASPASGWRVKRALEFMHANLAEDLNLAQLASVAGLGPTQFARTFRAATGEPPHRYLIRLRVDHARHLLEHTDFSVTDIAFRCGFEQSNHFTTMFRKVVGLTPRDYRKQRTT